MNRTSDVDREQSREKIDGACLAAELDELPRAGVADFIHRLAEANLVVHLRTGLDDWAEAVTRAAGDDVKLDHTENLLVALAKKNVITGRKAIRLLNNYLAESATVSERT